jgi:uncharacterized RDD family membrane protein YckC
MNEPELSLVPAEARRFQGTPAGIVTRLAANTIDALVTGGVVLVAYLGFVAVRFVMSPRSFQVPPAAPLWLTLGFISVLDTYLAAAWWISGRTMGNHVMGLRVVTGSGRRVPLPRAVARALLCTGFPVGLLWCVVSPNRRSVQDLIVRTAVVYDWLPRPGALLDDPTPDHRADDHPPATTPPDPASGQ